MRGADQIMRLAMAAALAGGLAALGVGCSSTSNHPADGGVHDGATAGSGGHGGAGGAAGHDGGDGAAGEDGGGVDGADGATDAPID
jgi:hypothetical protein